MLPLIALVVGLFLGWLRGRKQLKHWRKAHMQPVCHKCGEEVWYRATPETIICSHCMHVAGQIKLVSDTEHDGG